VWKRDPVPRLLPIIDGWNILDDNLLACPREHVEAVFAMLRRQQRRIEFTGGLEALSLQDYQVELLASLRPRPTMFFAYDPGDAFETLEHAARRLLAAGFTRASHHSLRVYVLIGYPKDTFAAAEQRLRSMLDIGFTPFAMLWRPETESQTKYMPEESWRTFQRRWARPAIIHGYGSPLERQRAKAARAAQRVDAKDCAQQRPAGRPKNVDNGGSGGGSVINGSRRPTGTSKAYALRRLRKDRPDIHARVLAGEISAHAGMVEAGFRKMVQRNCE
jgi:hypothetical protein